MKLVPIKNVNKLPMKLGPAELRTATDRIAIRYEGEKEFTLVYERKRLEYPRWVIPDFFTRLED